MTKSRKQAKKRRKASSRRFLVSVSSNGQKLTIDPKTSELRTIRSLKQRILEDCQVSDNDFSVKVSVNGIDEAEWNDDDAELENLLVDESEVEIQAVLERRQLGRDDLFSCARCSLRYVVDPTGEDLSSPVALDCGHSVCRNCACRSDSTSSNNSSRRSKLSSNNHSSSAGLETYSCPRCSRSTDCSTSPFVFHRTLNDAMARDHHATLLLTIDSDDPRPTCSSHNLPCLYYCKESTCHCLICAECVIFKSSAHKEHDIVGLSDGLAALQSTVAVENAAMVEADGKLLLALDDATSKIELLQSSRMESISRLRAKVDVLVALLRRVEEERVDAINLEAEEKLAALRSYRKRVGQMLSDVAVSRWMYATMQNKESSAPRTTTTMEDVSEEEEVEGGRSTESTVTIELEHKSLDDSEGGEEAALTKKLSIMTEELQFARTAISLFNIDETLREKLPELAILDYFEKEDSLVRLIPQFKGFNQRTEAQMLSEKACGDNKSLEAWKRLVRLAEEGSDYAAMLAAYHSDVECPSNKLWSIQDPALQRAIPFLHTLADPPNNNPTAQYVLAWYYLSSDDQKPELSAYYAKLAADQGEVKAISHWGYLQQAGIGVEKSAEGARTSFMQAAELGYAIAQYNVCTITEDVSEQVRWVKLAAEQDYAPALVALGRRYYHGDRGVPKNLAEAARCFRRASEKNLPSAMYSLAVCLENGQGVAKDMKSAVKLYIASANAGYNHAVSWVSERLGAF